MKTKFCYAALIGLVIVLLIVPVLSNIIGNNNLVNILSPTPTTDCGSILHEMLNCLPFFINQQSKPDTMCCSGYEYIFKNSPQCFCEADAILGFSWSSSSIVSLSTSCGVTTSPLTKCHYHDMERITLSPNAAIVDEGSGHDDTTMCSGNKESFAKRTDIKFIMFLLALLASFMSLQMIFTGVMFLRIGRS